MRNETISQDINNNKKNIHSFLENIVSVRGSNTPQNNTNGDYSETNEYTVVSIYE